MASFDVSRPWTILAPINLPAAQKAAEELSCYIEILRRRSGIPPAFPPIMDVFGTAPAETVPVILLNSESGNWERNGFTWRAAQERIEIYGQSERGLCNGVFDFLSALGLSWPEPDREILPPVSADQPVKYPMEVSRAYKPSPIGGAGDAASIQRFFMDPRAPLKSRKSRIIWAARNQIDVLIFSFRDAILKRKPSREKADRGGASPASLFVHPRRILLKLMKSYALQLERGGWELSLLVPRRYFFFHRDFFRMNSGQRLRDHHFCPTNPATIRLIRKQGRALFSANPGVEVFHLWPDRGYEKTWCSCPTCRAFTPAEQNRIAVNAAADALAAVNPRGRISFYEEGEGGDIPLRPNTFRIDPLSVAAARLPPRS
ncbi:MAG: DUF4838 domain-containing protein [Treponema sp.]|nr:DUF4838 domain-containing protein [Treponema sp.]